MINTESHFPGMVTMGYFDVRLVAHAFDARLESVVLPSGGKSHWTRIETPRSGWGARRPNGTRQWKLLYTVSGGGLVLSPGRDPLRVGAREALLFRPGTPQYYELDWGCGRWVNVWAFFEPRPEWVELLGWPEEWPGFMKLSIPKRHDSVSYLFEAYGFSRQPFPTHGRFVLNSLEDFLLRCNLLVRKMHAPATDSRVLRALDMIRGQYSREDLDTAALASPLGLSPSRLEHLFREQTGHTPRYYLEQERFTHARLLLAHSNKTVAEISYAIGIPRANYFSYRFRKHEGCSPKEYRNKSLGL